jgi:hypothetical protein
MKFKIGDEVEVVRKGADGKAKVIQAPRRKEKKNQFYIVRYPNFYSLLVHEKEIKRAGK